MNLFILNCSEKYIGLKCSLFFVREFVSLSLSSVSLELRLNLILDLLQTEHLPIGLQCGETKSVAVNPTEQ
jgi:hypothetical protein